MGFFGFDNGEKKKDGGLKPFGQGLGLKYNGTEGEEGLSLQKIFEDYGFLNMWSSENLDISGSNTTLLDYASEHDLVNPAAINQPTFNAENSEFNDKPSLSFNGSNNYVRKLTSNWRASDSTGVMVMVYKSFATTYGLLASSDNAGNGAWITAYQNTMSRTGYILNGAVRSLSTTTDSDAKVSSIAGNGTVYKIFLNGVDDTDSSSTYQWLNTFPTQRDDIAIGAATRASIIYGEFDWVFGGYMPYTDDQTIVDLQEDLKEYYNIT